MVYMLTAGHFRGVARLLRETQIAIGRSTSLVAEHRTRLLQLPERLSAPEALSQLLQALDETPTLPPGDELAELFDQLRPTALATVFQWTAKIDNEKLRPLLEAAADRLAGANTAELVRLVQSPDLRSFVGGDSTRRFAQGAGRRAVAQPRFSTIRTPRAGSLAVHALAEIASPGALQGLERAHRGRRP